MRDGGCVDGKGEEVRRPIVEGNSGIETEGLRQKEIRNVRNRTGESICSRILPNSHMSHAGARLARGREQRVRWLERSRCPWSEELGCDKRRSELAAMGKGSIV